MSFLAGSGIIGSAALQTSVAGQEIVPAGYRGLINFQLMNDQICTVSINGESPIYLRAGQGIKTKPEDVLVKSVKIQENGITFNWIATHTGEK